MKMCQIGERLRANAYAYATRIRSDAWQRAGALERRKMLAAVDAANAASQEYQAAFAAWREHYQACKICQEALHG